MARKGMRLNGLCRRIPEPLGLIRLCSFSVLICTGAVVGFSQDNMLYVIPSSCFAWRLRALT